MARYRIVQRPAYTRIGTPVFDVEERCWFHWEARGVAYFSMEEAEARVKELQEEKRVERKVVKEYD